MRRLGILFLMAMAAAGICAGQEAKKAAPASVAIRAGKILDVRTGNYQPDQIIWIEGDKIKAIGNAAA
jgi:imidazolonepropionase-like amidohydrolase